MKILYLGDMAPHTGSWQRARCLQRMGHDVTACDLEGRIVGSGLLSKLHYRTGYRFLQTQALAALVAEVGNASYDLVWVNGGAIYGPKPLGWLKKRAGMVVNYNNDDPTGPRDWRRWHSFRRAIPLYDRCAVVRQPNVAEYQHYGAKEVLRTWMSYDEVEHDPSRLAAADIAKRTADVLFIGTWMPERGGILKTLIEAGVALKIYGTRWERAREWLAIKKAWHGNSLRGSDYVAAIAGAKVCIGLVSHGNRDEYTERSMVIPRIGSLLLAERTPEHQQLYAEGREAVFWNSPGECAAECIALLKDETRRCAIAAAGQRKVLTLPVSNLEVLTRILSI